MRQNLERRVNALVLKKLAHRVEAVTQERDHLRRLLLEWVHAKREGPQERFNLAFFALLDEIARIEGDVERDAEAVGGPVSEEVKRITSEISSPLTDRPEGVTGERDSRYAEG